MEKQKTRKKNTYFKFTLLFFLFLISATAADSYWQQFVHYTMDIKLDTTKQDVIGSTSIVYVNKSPDTLDRIYMHLYPNAFQEGSVKYREFMQEYGRLGRIAAMLEDMTPYESEIEIHSFGVEGAQGVTSSDFHVDDTILSAYLPEPLNPGDSLLITLDWTHHTGEMIERAGRIGDQYNMAQWYPKMVVYDQKGWHDDPFHAEGEFYGEFGTFDVTLDVPKSYIVGATGVVVQGDPGWESVKVDTSRDFSEWLKEFKDNKEKTESDERRVVSFHAEDVHDFAWIASADFLYEHGSWDGIDVHVLYNDYNGDDWHRVVRERSERALEWLSARFGRYAYPQASVTDRPRGGGMEYPMLVMNGSNREGLIVHEIGHIWFYGMMGNNEVDESWLDEGFASFVTRWYLEDRYPPSGMDLSLKRYKPYQRKYWKYTPRTDRDQWSCIRFNQSGKDEPISRSSYLFDSGSVYRYNAYTKPSLMLRELRYLFGDSLFIEAMHAYFDRWHMKHVTEKDFVGVMEEFYGQDMDWFFDAWLHDTPSFDAGISGWSSKRGQDGNWDVTVDLVQKGNRFLPLDIHTTLANGDVVKTRWNDHLWTYNGSHSYSVPGEPKKLVIDPDKFTLDADRRNNQTGRMKHKIMFRQSRMDYRPIDAFVVKWSPLLYYHEADGYTPGIHLTRTYGHYVSFDLKTAVGTESGNIGWEVSGHRNAIHYRFFDENDISGMQLSYKRIVSKKYGVGPHHNLELGLYSILADDDSRTNLYDTGRVTAGYFTHSIPSGGHSITTNFTTAVGGVSDWTFSRLTSELRLNHDQREFGISNRTLFGVSWYDENGIPAQERFTIEGAGSGDVFNKAYLRDESSFFGLADERTHYHLPGDANLRGYYGQGYTGAESVISNSLDVTARIPVKGLKADIAAFFDTAFLWGSQWTQGDEGFDGNNLSDAGLGIRLEKTILGYPLAIRVDCPFWLSEPAIGDEEIDFNRWVFSFQKSF